MTSKERKKLMTITRRLMLSENFGDVHDEINTLHDLLDLPRPKGNFYVAGGWTRKDLTNVGAK